MSEHTWNGAYWSPLIPESTFGIALRLSRLNGLNAKGVRELIARRGARSDHRDFYRTSWIDHERVAREFGWEWTPAEAVIDGPIWRLHNVLWAPHLRYCPICMQGGFHAIWFQLTALQICPLHGCSLEDACTVCGTPLGPYHLAPPLFNQPGCCHLCAQPFVGAPFLQHDQLDFYLQRDAIERVFSPFHDWLRSAHRRLIILHEATTIDLGGEEAEDRRLILQSAIQTLVPYPVGCMPAACPPVMFQLWQSRSPELRRTTPSRYGYMSGHTAAQPYLATLRRLLHLIRALDSGSKLTGHLVFDGDTSGSLAGWSENALALLLLRCAFENMNVLDIAAPLDGVGLARTALSAAVIGHALRPGACRAVIVATYAMLVLRARRYLAQGCLSRSQLVTSAESEILWSTCVAPPYLYGVSVMPALPILDTWRQKYCCHPQSPQLDYINDRLAQTDV
ncbi:hypothetical protein [Ralstonia pseudosolanacearum]|uniref:hypothetical protein n=1 Tax=Ralstonia pseudosolanacearum TaxID=1310165 RepID=UPI003CE98A19